MTNTATPGAVRSAGHETPLSQGGLLLGSRSTFSTKTPAVSLFGERQGATVGAIAPAFSMPAEC